MATKIEADITFVNGSAECGCRVDFSSGHGEYSDCHYVYLCQDHRRGTKCSGFIDGAKTCAHGHPQTVDCVTGGVPVCVEDDYRGG